MVMREAPLSHRSDGIVTLEATPSCHGGRDVDVASVVVFIVINDGDSTSGAAGAGGVNDRSNEGIDDGVGDLCRA